MEISKNKFNLYASLGTVKMRRRHGLFTVEGVKTVSECSKSYILEALVCVNGYEPEFDCGDAPVYDVTREQMSRLSNLSTESPVMGVFRMPADKGREGLAVADALYVALDGVQDPGNLGTIIRTCHWFGIRSVFASYDTVDLFNPKALQAAMGSTGHVDVTYCNLADLFDANPGLPVYGTMLEGENLFMANLTRRGFIVMGNEGKGLSSEVRGKVDTPLFIPPGGDDHSESLNVSIATAIVVAQFCK